MTHIILIPGLMNDGWVWRHQIGALSRFGQVTVAHNDQADSLGDMADQILASARGPLAVVGHSMGGCVALEVAARAPERLERMALLGTRIHVAAKPEIDARLALVRLARDEGMAAVAREWLPPMLAQGRRADRPLVAGITEMLQRCNPEIFAGQQKALIGRRDQSALLQTIACPLLSVAGTEDAGSPPELHRTIADAAPRGYLRIVEGSGHMLPLEAPDRITALLIEWMERQAS